MSNKPHTSVLSVMCTMTRVARCHLLTWTLDSTIPHVSYVITALSGALVNNNTADLDLLKALRRVDCLALNNAHIVKDTFCTKSALLRQGWTMKDFTQLLPDMKKSVRLAEAKIRVILTNGHQRHTDVEHIADRRSAVAPSTRREHSERVRREFRGDRNDSGTTDNMALVRVGSQDVEEQVAPEASNMAFVCVGSQDVAVVERQVEEENARLATANAGKFHSTQASSLLLTATIRAGDCTAASAKCSGSGTDWTWTGRKCGDSAKEK